MKHQEHIVCVKSSLFNKRENGLVDYTLKVSDLMLGQRAVLENDVDFRQVLPISIFMNNGKIWAYERTPKGGESRLHNKVSVAVGGHWDMDDIVTSDGVIDVNGSFAKAMDREIEEEISLTSKIIKTYQLPKVICADDTEVDRLHIAIVYVHELDGEGIDSSEDQLKTTGLLSPKELLEGDYNLESWARIICEILTSSDNDQE